MGERKYFDSGDYALSKAGKNPAPVGEEHPAADNIPHLQPTTNQIPVVPGLSPPKHHGLENEVIDEEPANGQPPLSPKDTVAPQGLGAHLQHLGGLAGTQQPPAHPPAPGFMRRPSNLQNNAQFRVVQKD
ncbi:hypothetical protein GGI07_000859 [Coemansia sp. Benny D115]|nr:hypothetical protein GGI07_000859 [Coemansia sp. Benny D115]